MHLPILKFLLLLLCCLRDSLKLQFSLLLKFHHLVYSVEINLKVVDLRSFRNRMLLIFKRMELPSFCLTLDKRKVLITAPSTDSISIYCQYGICTNAPKKNGNIYLQHRMNGSMSLLNRFMGRHREGMS